MLETIQFFGIRILLTIIAFWIAYTIIYSYAKPTLFYENCLTDTNKCSAIELYRYKNNFIARDQTSELWFWYNGSQLFLYGQLSLTCQRDGDVPVNVFNVTKNGNSIEFHPMPNQCIKSVDQILSIYQQQYGVENERIFIRLGDENNIFNIIQQMYNNNIFFIK